MLTFGLFFDYPNPGFQNARAFLPATFATSSTLSLRLELSSSSSQASGHERLNTESQESPKMTLRKAIKELRYFETWTDEQRIRVLIESLDALNNGDALEYLDHWIGRARALLERNPSSALGSKTGNASEEICDS
jgi:hypothetical protein